MKPSKFSKVSKSSDSFIPKADVYQIITDRMISLLESGTVPWRKPWNGAQGNLFGPAVLPSNYVSKKPYRGINVFLLACAGYSCPYWVTYNQAKDLGGSVKRGEKGFPVVFWKRLPKTDRETGAPVLSATGKPESIMLLRYFTAFNLEQCDGIKWTAPIAPKPEEGAPVWEPLIEAQKIADNMPSAPLLRHGGSRACYSSPRRGIRVARPRAAGARARCR